MYIPYFKKLQQHGFIVVTRDNFWHIIRKSTDEVIHKVSLDNKKDIIIFADMQAI